MAVIKYISTKEVIAKVYRDLNIEQEDRWIDMVEWIAEALHKIGAHPQYVEQVTKLQVKNYRAAIPCNLFRVQQIEFQRKALKELGGSFDNAQHYIEGNNRENLGTTRDYGYTINDAFFNFNFTDEEVTLSFIAIPVDIDGFPLVPDDESYKEALYKYIIMKMKFPEMLAGKIHPNLYQKLESDWHKYCAQARGKGYMPSIDELEAIKNQWMRLMPRLDRHKTFFKRLGDGERTVGNDFYGNDYY